MRYWCYAALLLLSGCSKTPPTVMPHERGAIPDKLSSWGVLYEDGAVLKLAPGVRPYGLNTPLFSDYAQKLRTVWLPPGSQASVTGDEEQAIDFPVGTIITKTFYYPRGPGENQVLEHAPRDAGESLVLTGVRLVETRVLIRHADGWQAIPYTWDPDQKDASLALAGDSFRFQAVSADGKTEDFTYAVPDANQCAGCHASNHTARLIQPIGPKLRHLNRDYDYAEGRENQLRYWQKLGWLESLPAELPRNAVWNDPATGDLEARARAYLDINCGHCHNRHGAAKTAGLFLNKTTTDPHELGLCKAPVAAGRGSGSFDFDVNPGKPEASILSYRLGSTDPGVVMPELGRALVHTEGLNLIKAWIKAMPGACQRSDVVDTAGAAPYIADAK